MTLPAPKDMTAEQCDIELSLGAGWYQPDEVGFPLRWHRQAVDGLEVCCGSPYPMTRDGAAAALHPGWEFFDLRHHGTEWSVRAMRRGEHWRILLATGSTEIEARYRLAAVCARAEVSSPA